MRFYSVTIHPYSRAIYTVLNPSVYNFYLCVWELLQLRKTSLDSSPALLVEGLVLLAVQPIQLVAVPVPSWIPALLRKFAFGLFEGDSGRDPGR